MKTPVALFLAVSLLANVALLTLLGWRGDTTPTSGPASTSSSSHRSNPTAPADYAATLDPRLWPALVTDDSLVLRARLRAAGFPEDLVRAAAETMV